MADATYIPKVYRTQGGSEFVVASSGAITVESGGSLDIESGGSLEIAGTQVTATAAQLNQSAGLTTSSVVVAAATLAIPVTHRVALKSTGGAEALTLANGTAGQSITIYTVAAVGTGTLTPATATGFVSVALIAAGDTITLEYIDDTIGWIVIGAAGVLAPPVIALT